jgi:Rrf2 family protein
MTSLLKISEAASLALHTVSVLSRNGGETATTHEIATGLGVSEAHLSKVLQRLTKAGIVESIRGPKGGFKLRKSGDKVTLLDVYEAMEGKLRPDGCLLGRYACGGKCMLGEMLKSVNELVMRTLVETKVSQASEAFGGRNSGD